jgi:hypothetical protein
MRSSEHPSLYELTTVQREIWEVLSLAQDHHDIKLVAGADIVEIKAAFSWDITSNLLGQTGFFDNSAVSFHPAFEPPCFDVERIRRH